MAPLVTSTLSHPKRRDYNSLLTSQALKIKDPWSLAALKTPKITSVSGLVYRPKTSYYTCNSVLKSEAQASGAIIPDDHLQRQVKCHRLSRYRAKQSPGNGNGVITSQKIGSDGSVLARRSSIPLPARRIRNQPASQRSQSKFRTGGKSRISIPEMK